ncbi:hypothetical protein DFS34DRAFT_272148 [Phlyctochytrium arcticum]|nr:hypothetical protein DFS34DRAFT_272148 [Phlyctochytrium arcticum]
MSAHGSGGRRGIRVSAKHYASRRRRATDFGKSNDQQDDNVDFPTPSNPSLRTPYHSNSSASTSNLPKSSSWDTPLFLEDSEEAPLPSNTQSGPRAASSSWDTPLPSAVAPQPKSTASVSTSSSSSWDTPLPQEPTTSAQKGRTTPSSGWNSPSQRPYQQGSLRSKDRRSRTGSAYSTDSHSDSSEAASRRGGKGRQGSRTRDITSALQGLSLAVWESGGDSEEDLLWENLDEETIAPISVGGNPARRPRVASTFAEHDTAITKDSTTLHMYELPASFKTHDLDDIFQDLKTVRGGYQIKWLTDTEALIIFLHPDAAKSAYARALGNPFIRVKPYTGKVAISKEDRPVVARPIMTDMVARRLVAGALGVRAVPKSKEEYEKDLLKLQSAKAKRDEEKKAKELREKQVAAAWDS